MRKVAERLTEGYRFKTGVKQQSIFTDFLYGDMAFQFDNVDTHSKIENLRMDDFERLYSSFSSLVNKQTATLDFSK